MKTYTLGVIMKNKYKFYEIVELKHENGHIDMSGLDTRDVQPETLLGIRGVIIGMAQGDNGS